MQNLSHSASLHAEENIAPSKSGIKHLAARLLASDADRADIAARDAHARQRGVNAVPTFVIANQYVLSGAQPVDLWGKVIEDLLANAAPAQAPTSGH